MKRTANCPDTEPDVTKFEMPSVGEHDFQVVDVIEDKNSPDIVMVKLEVASGAELGRSILHRVNLDDSFKGFFATRLLLKAIGEPNKGAIEIDTDNWIGRSFVASIVHNVSSGNGKTYANIDKFNFNSQANVATGSGDPKEVKPEDWTE